MRGVRLVTLGIIVTFGLAFGQSSCVELAMRLQDIEPGIVQKLFERRLPEQPRFVPGEIIVKLKPTVSPKADTLVRMGVQALERLTSGGELLYQI